MVKKLLLKVFTFWALILTSALGWGQCEDSPTSVTLTNETGSSICEGEVINFSSSVDQSNPSVPYEYQWQVQLNGGSWTDIGTNSSDLLNYNAAVGNNKFRLEVTYCAGTTAPSTITSSPSATIIVYEDKTGSVSISADRTNICPGDPINFTSAPTNHGGSGATYEWRLLNDNSLLSTSSSFSSTSIPDGGQVKLYMTSSVPCVDPFESNTITITHKDGIPAQPAGLSLETESDLSICPNTAATFSVTNDPIATSYVWSLPTGWSGTSSTNTINITTGAANVSAQTISVKAVNECGESSLSSLDVTVGPGTPDTPSEIQVTDEDNDDVICPGEIITLSVINDPEVTGYTWNLPSGWSGSSTSNTIQVSGIEFGENGTVSVFSSNECLSSSSRTLSLSVNEPVPSQPGAISGNALVCPGEDMAYSIDDVQYADSYEWVLDGNPVNGVTGTDFTFNSSTVGDHILEVLAINECGQSTASSINIEVDNGAPDAVTITNSLGESSFCEGASGLLFSVNPDAKVDNYTWTVPNGWDITSNNGNSITVTAGSFGQNGNISVTASSGQGCGEVSNTFAVSIKDPVPSTPGAISGPTEVCMGSNNTFTVEAVNYATSYEWNLSDDSSIVTTEPSVDFPINSFGSLTLNVKAINGCGDSSASTNFTIDSYNGTPAQTGTITTSLGNNPNVCPPLAGVTFSVPIVTNATGYEWDLPDGWEITNTVTDSQYNTITVNITATGNYSSPTSISVAATNVCGPGTSSSLGDIGVDDYIVTDLGDDLTICRDSGTIELSGNISFGNKKFDPSIIASTGTISNIPTNVSGSFQFNYTPPNNFSGDVTISMNVEKPKGGNSSCGDGTDEMVITVLENPTANFTTSNAEICYNTGTTLNINGTPNTTVTYLIGATTSTVNLDASGNASINTGNLTQTTTYALQSIAYTEGPGCSQNLTETNIVTVNPIPDATFNYVDGPFCNSDTNSYSPQFTNTTGIFEGGIFSASGLTVNPADGSFSPNGVAAGTYTINYDFNDPLSCGYSSVSTEITIYNTVEITLQPVGERVCAGDQLELTVGASGDGLGYQWYKGTVGAGTALSGETSSTLIFNSATTSNAGNYYVEVTGTSPCSSVFSVEAELLVDQNIIINSQPDNTTTCLGGAASFSVDASAGSTNVDYKWYKGSPGSGTPVGENSPTLELTGVTLDDSGNYYVEISGPEGFICEPLASQAANLSVRELPEVQISGTTQICDGGDTSIYFTNGTPNAVVLYTVNSGNEQTIPLNASGEATLSTNSLTVVNEEVTTYTYELTGVQYPDAPECLNSSVTGAAIVTVNPTPDVDVSFENDQVEFCNDSYQGIFTPNLTGSGAYLGGIFSAEGLTVDSDTGAFSPANATAGEYTLQYFLDASGGCSELAATLDIIIYTSVEITSEPFPVAVCTANSTQLEVAASGDNLSYQWYKVGATADSEVGTDSPVLQLNNATSSTAGDYYVVVSGNGACASVPSSTVSVVVDENIIVTEQPVSQEVCMGENITLNVDATASGNNENIVYTWMFRPANSSSNNDWTYVDGGQIQTLSLENVSLEQAGQYRAEINGPDGYACDLGYSQAVVLSVNEPPTVDAGTNISACSTDGTIAIGGDASTSNNTSLEWSTSGSGTFEDASALSTNYLPGNGETGQVTLTLTAYANTGCSNISDDVIVDISNLPVINSFSYSATEFCISINTGQSPTLDILNAGIGDGEFSFTPAITGNVLALNTSTGEINPSGSNPGTYNIVFEIPSDGICEAVSANFDVTIGDLPLADFSYNQASICKDTRTTNPTLTLDPSGLQHMDADSFSSSSGLVFIDSATGEIDIDASTAGDYTITRTVDYTGTAEDGCNPVTDTFDISIYEKPIPDFSYTNNGEFCSDETDPVPTLITGAEIGTFSFTTTESGNLVIDQNTGTIDLDASDPGTYTVRNTVDDTSDGCEEVYFEFDITIYEKKDPSFSYTSAAYCVSEGIAQVDETTLTTGGTFQAVSLGNHLDSNTGEITWDATDTQLIGMHTITYTIPANGECEEVFATYEITIDALPVGGALAWSNNERIYLTCEVQTNSLDETISLTGEIGEVLEWEYRTVSTGVWSIYNSQNSTLNSSDFENMLGNSVESTVFRARIGNGACSDPSNTVYSQTAILSVIPDDIKPSPVESDPDVLCYNEIVTLSSETGYGAEYGKFEGGQFTEAGIKNKGWRFTNPGGGSNDYDAAANNGRADHWLKMNASGGPDGKVYTGSLPTATTGTTIQWTSIANVNEKFALVTGNNDSWMETPVFSLGGMDEAIFTWDQGYNLTTGATITVELSTDGGASYDIVLFTLTSDGSTEIGSSGYYTDFGGGTPTSRPKNKMVIDLGDYLGYSNLRVRFNYNGVRDGDVWAVDNVKVPEGPQDVQLIWYYDEDLTDPNNELEQIGQVNQTTVSYPQNGNDWPKLGWNDFEVRTALLLDSNGDPCESINNFETIQVFVFDEYTTNVTADFGECGNTTVNLSATITGTFQGDVTSDFTTGAFKTVDGYTGAWEITMIGEGEEDYSLKNPDGTDSNPDPYTNPEAIFEANDLGHYSFSWVLTPTAVYPDNYKDVSLRGQPVENAGCPPMENPLEVQLPECTTLDFDGIDDYVSIDDIFAEAKTFEMWIFPESNTGTIISGPGIEITMADLENVTPDSRWYHIALRGNVLYIDGISTNKTINATGNGNQTLIGASWNNNSKEPENYFSGWIEEVRIWKSTLAEKEIRFMMNQRLELNSKAANGDVQGEIIPNKAVNGSYNIGGGFNLDKDGEAFYNENWNDLIGYYRLISEFPDPVLGIIPDTYKPTNGFTPDLSLTPVDGRLHNMTTHQQNTSPTPYFSGADGDWITDETWARPAVWDPPHTGAIEWNIARVNHNIESSGKDIIMLGILSETPGKVLTIDSDRPIRITHYLLLDGNMDLINESQLLQDHGSILAEESAGWLQRDQQGKKLSFNYNYWSSPVSAQGSIPNNASYSILEILRDSRHKDDPNAVIYSDQYAAADGTLTDPMTLSTYWMWKFKGSASLYADWQWIGSTGSIDTGEGYTMKGTDGTVDAWDNTQNYTFKGKPHNGNIILDFSGGDNHNYLIGNPYPSALDANQFINENIGGSPANSNFNGTLYFWSHFAGQSHYLQEYVGGYAAYTLAGGIEPASSLDQRINNTGESGGKRAEQYIPVGQGFFVNKVISSTVGTDGELDVTEKTGGNILTLMNTQRAFETEAGESVFHSQEKKTINSSASKNTSNGQRKIWLRFKSPMKYHRQLLVTADPNATSGFDLGYDAPLIEDIEEDMYWSPDNYKFVIQGVNNFDLDQELNLEFKVKEKGQLTISIDELKNVPDDVKIFIRDSLLQVTHDLRAEDYVVESEAGTFSDRFKMVFHDRWAIEEPEEPILEEGPIEVIYFNGTREIIIKNPELLEISRVYLNNMLGQQVHVYYNVPKDRRIPLPVQRFGSGVYIVKVHTEQGTIIKKVILE